MNAVASNRSAVGGLALATLFLTNSVIAQQQPAPQQPAPQQPAPQAQNAPTVSLGDLQGLVNRLRENERRIAQEREQRFRAELQRQQRLAQEATQRRDQLEARSNALDREWTENERRIAEQQELLSQQEGNLGELFGVTRQIAGDSASVLQASVLTTQFGIPTEGEERAEFLRRLAGARELPSITELERLWSEILREMSDQGNVVKFNALVTQRNPDDPTQLDMSNRVPMDVVRVGPFTVSSNGQYLAYLSSAKSLTTLHG